MKLHIVDILIICAYLMVIVAIGLFLKRRRQRIWILIFWAEVVAVLYVGAVECIGHV